VRRVVSGRFELGVSPTEAIAFFTPEGEREWVPGWDPVYPTGEPSESPGTVFTTNVGGVDTIWLIQRIDRDECSASYVRVTPGHHAGTVHVRCTDGAEEGCRVRVTYDLSLLPGGDPSEMDAYDEASFATTMTEWANAVRQRLGL
jgi:hypothetical protein